LRTALLKEGDMIEMFANHHPVISKGGTTEKSPDNIAVFSTRGRNLLRKNHALRRFLVAIPMKNRESFPRNDNKV
jgi:hypothetical protein